MLNPNITRQNKELLSFQNIISEAIHINILYLPHEAFVGSHSNSKRERDDVWMNWNTICRGTVKTRTIMCYGQLSMHPNNHQWLVITHLIAITLFVTLSQAWSSAFLHERCCMQRRLLKMQTELPQTRSITNHYHNSIATQIQWDHIEIYNGDKFVEMMVWGAMASLEALV
jgi:hypothetical protein